VHPLDDASGADACGVDSGGGAAIACASAPAVW
jgi:hypothetical protein